MATTTAQTNPAPQSGHLTSKKPKRTVKQVATISIFGLAMLNIVAVLSLRGLPAVAEYGLGSIFYYLLAAVLFLVPTALVAAELATAWPEKGGVFRWVGEAFGYRWALVAMFMLVLEVTIWFPTALTFGAVALAYTGPDLNADAAVASNRLFILAVVLVVYWLATFIALKGAKAFSRVAKWGGVIGTLVPGGILIVLGFAYVIAGNKPQIEISWSAVVPDFSNFSNIVLAASIFLFYAGMEMNAIHVKDVTNPTRSYPIAVLIAAVGTVVVFVLGALAVAFIVPKNDINLTQSLLTAYNDLFVWAHIAWAGPIIAVALAIGVFAGIVTWISGPSSGLLVVAKAGNLPKFFQRTNKHGMGRNIMLLQAAIVTVLAVLFIVLPSVQSVYQILSQLTVILYLVMYLLMFAAVIRLRLKQPNRPRPYRIPGGKVGVWVVAGVGFLGSLVAMFFSFIPPGQIAVGSPVLYVGLLVVLSVIFVAVPFVVFRMRKQSWRDAHSDFAEFTWETENRTPGTVTLSAKAPEEARDDSVLKPPAHAG
ncbi:amino acid transporter [Subtercola boreus]|uniref:Amino acid transporter n=1 Tax=Subtercola boreus TaxID=120213 RepID=A0A3E0VAR2_9MICO|nr:putative glutamine/gamma-aminobutyrate antiporter GadC [Subtercola boreus]RFA06715.1 amino acid transporter [Subtercola boreus]